jgi:hypothetical protein
MSDPPKDSNVVSLGLEAQMAIARGLREWYQHVLEEGIPEHLRGGLAKLLSTEQPQSCSSDEVIRSAPAEERPAPSDSAEEPKADPATGPPSEPPKPTDAP